MRNRGARRGRSRSLQPSLPVLLHRKKSIIIGFVLQIRRVLLRVMKIYTYSAFIKIYGSVFQPQLEAGIFL
jgi:hypothetical protein